MFLSLCQIGGMRHILPNASEESGNASDETADASQENKEDKEVEAEHCNNHNFLYIFFIVNIFNIN